MANISILYSKINHQNINVNKKEKQSLHFTKPGDIYNPEPQYIKMEKSRDNGNNYLTKK